MLLCVSFWVNIGMFLTALPLAFGACSHASSSSSSGWRRTRSTLVALGIVVLALAVNLTLKFYYAEQFSAHDYSVLPVSLWPEALARLAANFKMVLYSHAEKNIFFACIAVASCATFFAPWRAKMGGGSPCAALWRASFLIGLAAITNYLFYGTNSWVRINHYEGRYLLMVYFLATCLLFGATAAALKLILGRGVLFVGLALIALIPFVSVKSYGYPAMDMFEMALEKRFGPFADKVVECRCTHVAGTYWKVWPVVFYSNVKLYRAGGGMVWGVSYRSDNTAGLWIDQVKDPWRVCALRGDPQADSYITRFGLAQAERVEIDGPSFEH